MNEGDRVRVTHTRTRADSPMSRNEAKLIGLSGRVIAIDGPLGMVTVRLQGVDAEFWEASTYPDDDRYGEADLYMFPDELEVTE